MKKNINNRHFYQKKKLYARLLQKKKKIIFNLNPRILRLLTFAIKIEFALVDN